MELLQDQELDSLASLEQRIHRAVELVARLRADVDSANAARDAAVRETEAAQDRISALTREVEALRAERQNVRGRVEKLLAQIDSLGAA
jgi:FtsZ-binding cell division protein ZapB